MKKIYPNLIRPLQISIDILLINLIIYFVYDKQYFNVYFMSYISLFWLITSTFFGFYKVYRFTRILMVFKLLVKQFLVFIFGYFTYFGIFNEGDIINNQLLILITIITTVSVVKFSWLFLLKKYRSLGNNFRTTIVIGFDNSTKNIIKLFKSKSNLGYKYLGFFSNNIFCRIIKTYYNCCSKIIPKRSILL